MAVPSSQTAVSADQEKEIRISYPGMEEFLAALADDIAGLYEVVDRLDAQWRQLLATTSGIASGSFAWAAGGWMDDMKRQIRILEKVHAALKPHVDNMKSIDNVALKRLAN